MYRTFIIWKSIFDNDNTADNTHTGSNSDNDSGRRSMVKNETNGASDVNSTIQNTITDTQLNLNDTSANNIVTTATTNDNATISTISTNRTSSTIGMTTPTRTPTQGKIPQVNENSNPSEGIIPQVNENSNPPDVTTEGARFATLSPSTSVSVPRGQSCRAIHINTKNDDTDELTYADDYSNGNEDGYDSDGARGPFYDAVIGERINYDEALLSNEKTGIIVPSLLDNTTRTLAQPPLQPVGPEAAPPQNQGENVLTVEAVERMTVSLIKIELQVCRVEGRGLPQSIKLKEETTDILNARARGIVKAAVLKGDPQVKDMIAFSVYDTKPVHFISTAATSLKWIKKKKLVYNKVTQQAE